MSLGDSIRVRGISVNALFGVPRQTPRRGIFFVQRMGRPEEEKRCHCWHLFRIVTPLACVSTGNCCISNATLSCVYKIAQPFKRFVHIFRELGVVRSGQPPFRRNVRRAPVHKQRFRDRIPEPCPKLGLKNRRTGGFGSVSVSVGSGFRLWCRRGKTGCPFLVLSEA